MEMNPIHQNEDCKWYFWDETWAFEEGPFDTEEDAKTALGKYFDYVSLSRVKETNNGD